MNSVVLCDYCCKKLVKYKVFYHAELECPHCLKTIVYKSADNICNLPCNGHPSICWSTIEYLTDDDAKSIIMITDLCNQCGELFFGDILVISVRI